MSSIHKVDQAKLLSCLIVQLHPKRSRVRPNPPAKIHRSPRHSFSQVSSGRATAHTGKAGTRTVDKTAETAARTKEAVTKTIDKTTETAAKAMNKTTEGAAEAAMVGKDATGRTAADAINKVGP